MNKKVNYSERLLQLSGILRDAEQYGLDFEQLQKQITELLSKSEDETIKMVLISAFSDGKTSTVAGLLGRVEDNMKIDTDESSDEIVVYHPQGLKQGFEIVDTPGLFGTKEKEVEGNSVRFSEITEKYISQAHIILYICSPVNPLKQSHAYVIEQLLRTYNKLDSTIFVINKMDEMCDMKDETDYPRMVEIKKDNLRQRLRDTINLTDEEEQRLHIVCIAAAPKGKSMEYWQTKIEDYNQRSHIELLRNEIEAITEKCDTSAIVSDTQYNTLVDLTTQAVQLVKVAQANISKVISDAKDKQNEINQDFAILRKDLKASKDEMTKRLDDLENTLLKALNSATQETFIEELETKIGTTQERVTFYKVERKVNEILSECSETNNFSFSTHIQNIEQSIEEQDGLLQEGLSKATQYGTKLLKNVNLTGESVKAIRNVIAKSYKFKPWGAIKLANKLNIFISVLGYVIDGALGAYKTYKENKQRKEFEDLKSQLKDGVKSYIQDVLNTFNTDEKYYENYAPSYLQLEAQLKERQQQFDNLQSTSDNFKKAEISLSNWLQQNAEDVEYEEV